MPGIFVSPLDWRSAGVLVACIAAPFFLDQLATVAARGGGTPVVIHHFEVLGEMFAPLLRRILDLPAYWLIELPIEFPATYVAGVIALVVALRSAASGLEKTAWRCLRALQARASLPRGCWPARWATTMISGYAQFCPLPWS